MSTRGDQPADSHRHCPECDYNLTGVPSGRCPWCGWAIDTRRLANDSPGMAAQRIGAALTCVVLGAGSWLALISLAGPTLSTLSLRDGLVVIGVSIAGTGHLTLAAMLILGHKRWPLRHQDAAKSLRFVGWLSIVLGVIGATLLLRVRVIQGFAATSVFEFTLGAVFFTAPGWTLLTMTLLAFEHKASHAPHQRRPTYYNKAAARHGAPYVIEVLASYREPQISQKWTDEPRPTTPAIEADIARTWEAELALAQEWGGNLYNGNLVRVRSLRAGESTLMLSLGPTNYRDFLGTNLCGAAPAFRAGGNFLANALGVSATVITRDGHLAYGRRSHRVAYHAGFVHTFGGMVEDNDRQDDGSFNLFGCIKREVCEELGLRPAQLSGVRHVGFVRDLALQQPEMLFDVTITLARAELESLFSPEQGHGEHVAIEFLADEPDAAQGFLERIAPIAPVAEAALLLHGRHAWGTDWFEQISLMRYGDPSRREPEEA